MATKHAVIESEAADKLASVLEEATRSTREGVKYFIEPAQGTLSRAVSRRHHIIFGRRGSGKSSLLNKILAEFNLSRFPTAYVDLETFKGHSYPDVLVSILLKTLSAYREWLNTTAIIPATKKSFWQRLFGSPPKTKAHDKKTAQTLVVIIDGLTKRLDELLMEPDEAERAEKASRREQEGTSGHIKGSLSSPVAVTAKSELAANRQAEQAFETSQTYKSRKIEYLHRRILELKDLFEKLSQYTNGPAYLLLDDLYHIKPSDQAQVIDYFHRITKGTDTWLKIGTIRHRTSWYIPGRPPIGIKLGDDADEIDLDVTLEKYDLTKAFLLRILEQFCREQGIKLAELLSDGARDRLVLASGGVARDFLTLVRRSIDVARQRLASGDEFRGERISAEDVNKAAGELDSFKQEEFEADTFGDEIGPLTGFFDRIRDFCLETTNSSCILIDKDFVGPAVENIGQLVDLKFLHHVRGRVTVRDRPKKIFDAYMLDISQYSGERKRRNFDIIEFWGREGGEKLRRSRLIFEG